MPDERAAVTVSHVRHGLFDQRFLGGVEHDGNGLHLGRILRRTASAGAPAAMLLMHSLTLGGRHTHDVRMPTPCSQATIVGFLIASSACFTACSAVSSLYAESSTMVLPGSMARILSRTGSGIEAMGLDLPSAVPLST